MAVHFCASVYLALFFEKVQFQFLVNDRASPLLPRWSKGKFKKYSSNSFWPAIRNRKFVPVNHMDGTWESNGNDLGELAWDFCS